MIKPFTKVEKLTTTKYKAPRMIQARDISFNIEYGRFIKPLEQLLTKNHKYRYNFGKGNYDEIAKRIKLLKSRYNYYTELDHTSFDAHVTVEMLKLTHVFYRACYYHNGELRRLSMKTLNNSCKTRWGEKYKVKGTRMSGDVDTSLGNSLINYAILKECLSRLKIDGDVIVNGDDSILFTNQAIGGGFSELLKKFNMESKISKTSTNIHKIEFCRTKYVIRSDGTPTMMMDPQRIVEIFGMTRNVQTDRVGYLNEVAICNAHINKNTPIGLVWADAFQITMGGDHNFRHIDRDLIRVYEREKLSGVSNGTFTQDMFMAYPEIGWILPKIYQCATLLQVNKPHMIHINHLSQTIRVDPVFRVTG